MDTGPSSNLPAIVPMEASNISSKKENLLSVDILKTGLTDKPQQPLKETHILTDKRKAALQKARDAKKRKRMQMEARLEERELISHEMRQVLSDMRQALNEFKQARPLPLSNVAKQQEPLVQDVVEKVPRKSLPEEVPPTPKNIAQILPRKGFQAFLNNKVHF
jgi:hypothetical protein